MSLTPTTHFCKDPGGVSIEPTAALLDEKDIKYVQIACLHFQRALIVMTLSLYLVFYQAKRNVSSLRLSFIVTKLLMLAIAKVLLWLMNVNKLFVTVSVV